MRMFQLRNSLGPALGAVIGLSPLATPLHSIHGAPAASAANTTALEGRPPSFATIAKRTMPAVVNISTTSQRSGRGGSNDPIEELFTPFICESTPKENSQRSLGSGRLIGKDSEILTNYHALPYDDTI